MEIYKRNIEALKKTHPHLVEVLETTSVDKEKIIVSHMSSGELQIIYRKANTDEVVISDSHDLSGLPKRAAELLEQQDVKRMMLLLGFGLGGYPEALHARLKENGVLVVYEAVPEIFKAALEKRDLSLLLASPRFILILGEKTEDFEFIRKYHRKIVQKNFYILKQTGSIALNKPAYERFRTKVIEAKRSSDSGVATAIGRAEEWTNAFIKNIPIVLRTPGVIRLRNLFKEKPAIIVSAGPSIEKNLHLLKEAKGKAIIIAVDVVVPTLLPAGIMPDFIVALEASRKLFHAFENNPLLRFCPLVCTPEVDYETITSLYPGPVFLNPTFQHPVLKWFHNFWESKGFIAGRGGSVSHMAFAFAEYIGANVIALMGQDLCFREKLHAGNVTPLFYSETDVEQLRQRNPVVKDIFGEERYTTNQFLTFRIAFEKITKRFKGVVINATEGGMPIEGARTMRLKEFIDEYCQIVFAIPFETVLPLYEMKTAYDLSGLMTHVRSTISKLENIRKKAGKIVDCVVNLKTLKERNMLNASEAGRLIGKIAKLEKIVEDPILGILAPYRYRIENYLRRDEADNESVDAIHDSLDFYGELKSVIEQLLIRLDSLMKVLERESEVDDVLADGVVLAIERFFHAGVVHSETGMIREAVRHFEKAANEFGRIKEPDIQKKFWTLALNIHWLLAGLYVKQHRLYEAQDVLGVLMDFAPESPGQFNDFNKMSVKNLFETCEIGIKLWEKQQENLEQLLKKASQEYGSNLESGNFYLRIGDYESAKAAFNRSVDEEKAQIVTNNGDPLGNSIRRARLVASLYGFAQTYFAMNDIEKAVHALDMSLGYVIEMDKTAGKYGSEIRSLIAQLYERCGRGDKRSLFERTAAI